MSVYGEGLYRTADGELATALERPLEQLRARDWEVRGPDGEALVPVPTPEDKPPVARVGLRALQVRPGADVPDGRAGLRHPERWRCASSTSTARARRSRTRTPGCSRSSRARYLNGRAPLVFEDGRQQRDFVQRPRRRAAPALWRWSRRTAAGKVFNIGSGRPLTILELAGRAARRVLGQADWRRRSPASTASATSATASRTSRSRARRCSATSRRWRSRTACRAGRWLEGQIAFDRVGEARAAAVAAGADRMRAPAARWAARAAGRPPRPRCRS